MAVGYNPKIVTSGLTLGLDAANIKSYAGSGTTWTDLSGSGINGTLTNSPTYNAAGYFSFNYLNSNFVSFSNSSAIQFTGTANYTLEAWVYPTRNPGANNWTGIFDREDTSIGSRDGYNLYFLGSTGTNTFFATERFVAGVGSAVVYTIDQASSVNAWNYLVATYDGSTITLFHNNISRGTGISAGSITNTSKTLTIGIRGGQYFDGRIANCKMYNRALSTAEIAQNFNALRGRYAI